MLSPCIILEKLKRFAASLGLKTGLIFRGRSSAWTVAVCDTGSEFLLIVWLIYIVTYAPTKMEKLKRGTGVAKPKRGTMNLELPALRRKGNLIYKESVEGVSICVYTYGAEGKAGQKRIRTGRDYTLTVEPVPLDIALEPTPAKLEPFFKLGEVIKDDERGREIKLKQLGGEEQERAHILHEAETEFLRRRQENWPKVINPTELKRLALFAKYVHEDRKLRGQLARPEQLELAEKALLAASQEEQIALTKKIFQAMDPKLKEALIKKLRGGVKEGGTNNPILDVNAILRLHGIALSAR